MKRKVILIVGGCVLVVVAAPCAWFWTQTIRLDREYEEQLRLARAEGIPTTGDEFAATLPKVADSENAAPCYVRLAKVRSQMRTVDSELFRRLISDPSEATKIGARAALARAKPCLDLIDKAKTYPHCQFKRNWNMGLAVLFPELADVKVAARTLLIRGALAAAEGRVELALADARTAIKVSRHLHEEPHTISRLVARAVQSMALTQLASWSLIHRDQPAYLKEFASSMDVLPPPDLPTERRLGLVEVLSAIELCSTAKGRHELGLREEEVSPGESVLPLLQPRGVGRVKVVKAFREYWGALHGPQEGMQARCDAACLKLYQGLLSFPTAAHIYEALSSGGTGPDEVENDAARRVAYRAALRALSADDLSKPIKTDDLISPWNGKRVRYRHDGQRIEITVGADPGKGEPFVWSIPPKNPAPETAPPTGRASRERARAHDKPEPRSAAPPRSRRTGRA